MTAKSLPSLWGWLRSLVILRGSVLPRILPLIFLFGLYSALIVAAWQTHWPLPIGMLGELTGNVVCNLVLGLLLVFRTNSSYDRFWEGRKAWGDIVVNVRNLARTIQLCIPVQTAEQQQRRQKVLQMLPGFAVATKLHLRDMGENQELEPFFSPQELMQLRQSPNRPLQITLWIQDYLQQEFQQERIDTVRLLELNQFLNNIIQGLTACERIRQTPIPPAYLIYLRRLIVVYCLCLPVVLVPKLGWWTVPVVGIIGFILFGIEELGREIEDPFGFDPNDLPLDGICTMLVDNVMTISGIDVPDNTAPVPPIPTDSSLLPTH
ncbi:Putative membrane protein [Gloeomargarita lithophora Alchichica-D10]|uniref:Membrane protein n=1 Tax=Gloeomargarita lithophora Alchichica-D10 TaxID=1188229 RepID=A0A1J0AGB4_9CYAN|nr:bestrophin family ion channel [Gloeomargarita lithophora]APB34982.1 Putative membrane protein [Gloeomargarita lithophora Alchichica-D10]